jgi:hypothetical protein
MKQKATILGIMVVLQAGDLLSSRLAFAHGAVELNPLVNALGLWQAKLLVLCVLGLMLIRTTRLRRLWAVIMIYSCVVGWNLFLVAKAR